jgi:hypothetical protein
MRKSLSLSCHLAFIFFGSAALAARPFVTDDARTVDRGGCQVESFYKKQHAYPGSEFWFLPACNPSGTELTLGFNRIEGDRSVVLQGKTLLKPLDTNGSGYGFSLGAFRVNPAQGRDIWQPYVNGIGSFSFIDDRAVVHANLGVLRDLATWGLGVEALVLAPRVYGILETYGQREEKPTRHIGLRYWVVPNRVQVDSTLGEQKSEPARRFHTIGLRLLF